ncbi:hypothetical protein BJ944DRAFT_269147 [Cunninghamella echinulata]|nr:hypothetical protein BJ944DRAFT_269147 [Cunninghamella echinulata]
MDSQFAYEDDNNNVLDSDYVTLNGFMFCLRHGQEICDKCHHDNLSSNNSIIEDNLHERLTEEEFTKKWKGDEREQFNINHQWAKVNGKPGCLTHKKVGCNECFNWEEKLYHSIHGGRKPRQSRLHKKERHAKTDVLQ